MEQLLYLYQHTDYPTVRQWLLDTFPKLHVIVARKTWRGIFGSKDLMWLNTNVRNDHGILGTVYPQKGMNTKLGINEGDSPSFLYLVSGARGLNDPEQPNQPSWGGQFVRAAADQNH